MKINISKELSLPKEAVTSTIVIYGGKGMGKTNFASVFCEELHRCDLRFSYLDPVGVSWGLRSSADGKSAGLEILILGGAHGDIPIEPTAGILVADFVADENINVIVDFSRHSNGKMWSAGEKIRFVTDYSNRLFERQGEKRYPIMQIYDEAGRFVPQIIPKGAIEITKCIGAIEQLVELGRNIGIGVTLITQRSARMNKSVSELADMMIAFRTVGPNSVNAINDWLSENIAKEKRAKIIDEIRSLPVGKAMIVSPGWLGIEKAVQIRQRETFDSSATPRPGQQIKPPKKRAEINLSKYRERMAETIARSQADDPKELRTRIIKLERELTAAKKSPKPIVAAEPQIIEKPIVLNGQLKQLDKISERLEKLKTKQREANENFNMKASTLSAELATAAKIVSVALQQVRTKKTEAREITAARPVKIKFPNATAVYKFDRSIIKPATNDEDNKSDLVAGERGILQACARCYPMRLSLAQIARLAATDRKSSQSMKSSSFKQYKRNVSRRGLLAKDGIGYQLTEAGMEAINFVPGAPQTEDEIIAMWQDALISGERDIFNYVLSRRGETIPEDEISQAVGQSLRSSSFKQYLRNLVRNSLFEKNGDGVRFNERIFER